MRKGYRAFDSDQAGQLLHIQIFSFPLHFLLISLGVWKLRQEGRCENCACYKRQRVSTQVSAEGGRS